MALGVLSLSTAGLTGILSLSVIRLPAALSPLEPYFDSILLLPAIAAVISVGVVSLGFLYSRGWFEIYLGRECLRGVVLAATLATLFAVAVILIDLRIVFPYFHVPPPQSLLFYPAMAYVAEIVFHALPLALLLVVLGPLSKTLDSNRLVWWCSLLTSCLEPIFQMGWGFSKEPFSWADVYVGLHVFAFNFLQLYVFRRYDFVSMYTFRLVYYIQWHIVWGYVRLHVLF